MPTAQQIQKCTEQFKQMVRLLGYATEISGTERGRNILLNVKAEEPGRFIGKGGQNLSAMEFIFNRMMRQDDREFPVACISVEGYQRRAGEDREDRAGEDREERRAGEGRRGPAARPAAPRGDNQPRQDEVIKRRATDLAKEVKKWGAPKEMGPLSAPERRSVHLALSDNKEVVAESGPEDAAGKKKITIRLAGQSTD
jgi:predicted RNA-binding protein Jag